MPYGPTEFYLTVIKPYYKNNSFKPVQDTPEDALKDALKNTLKDPPENPLEDVLKKNYDQYAPKGDYNFDIIVVDIPQL